MTNQMNSIAVKVYSTKIASNKLANDEPRLLKARWSDLQLGVLKTALQNNLPMPDFVKKIDVLFGDMKIQLFDLRGVVLSNLIFENVDLAYCAFDYANFDKSVFSKTVLAYSRLCYASFVEARLDSVQASPIDAYSCDLSFASVNSSFFMYSNFVTAKFEKTILQSNHTENSNFYESINRFLPEDTETVDVRIFKLGGTKHVARVEEVTPALRVAANAATWVTAMPAAKAVAKPAAKAVAKPAAKWVLKPAEKVVGRPAAKAAARTSTKLGWPK